MEPEVPLLKKRLGDRFSDANVFLKKADVGDEAQIATFVNDVTGKFGKLDILVNLVGGFWGGKSIADTSAADGSTRPGKNGSLRAFSSSVGSAMRGKCGRVVARVQ